MKAEATIGKRNAVFLFWGILDAFYIIWYCVNSWLGERIPYFSDLSASITLLEQQGGVNLVTALLSWLLQFSIILSCLIFLLQKGWVKYLAYIQTPFRLFFLMPSLSVLLFAAQLLPGYGLIFLALIIVSEILKIWSLWKFV
ncbi:hypothetical protein BAY1663_03507 [Pseudomonas sp. BAY1663]|uniref:hypothetical protein n=1 Tax=Pseudomonas sp. BAY1663 TaxID=1439940 RepID=UPI00042DE85E|nr:hypothetical protein [Pseudomonas sp. BAY1663]EXF44055.1 hypothetical protein BAY1663_03507 [Pseudomonas sp. BAY1663]